MAYLNLSVHWVFSCYRLLSSSNIYICFRRYSSAKLQNSWEELELHSLWFTLFKADGGRAFGFSGGFGGCRGNDSRVRLVTLSGPWKLKCSFEPRSESPLWLGKFGLGEAMKNFGESWCFVHGELWQESSCGKGSVWHSIEHFGFIEGSQMCYSSS